MVKFSPFDAADCLDDEKTISKYITAAFKDFRVCLPLSSAPFK